MLVSATERKSIATETPTLRQRRAIRRSDTPLAPTESWYFDGLIAGDFRDGLVLA